MTSYLSEDEAENLQNRDVHLAQIADFRSDISRTIWCIEVSDGFFTLFHLSLTFFRPEFLDLFTAGSHRPFLRIRFLRDSENRTV